LARIAELEAENRNLREQLEAAQQQAARQAAPFRRQESRKVPAAEKKRPGRKPGHPGTCRPVPLQADETVEIPLSACPNCGGEVRNAQPLEQWIEDLPPIRPWVTRLVTWHAECPHCGEVRSTHPLQTSLGQGAAKVQLGPRALSLGAFLNKRLGLSMRNTCCVLQQFGLKFTPGGLSQALVRMAHRVQNWFESLQADLRQSPAVYGDETSWWVNGPGWWLWGFTTPHTTVYRVADNRGSVVVNEMLGDDFRGVLVSDCLASYNPPRYRKHKCIAHHLRAIAEARKRPDTPDPGYLDRWKWLFKAVNVLWKARPAMAPEAFARERARLTTICDQLLNRPVSQAGDVSVQNRLLKQWAHLLTCLDNPAVEPTNNRAERALRPAVIARKISCGNRTDRGRHCWEILVSLAVTCQQRGLHFIDELAARLPLAAKAG
jgi:rRNA maturation protein Nop10